MYPALEVAKLLLRLAHDDDDDITNLKLQKLLYYAQGRFLAAYDEPLFVENVVRWTHGPVVPEVYHEYRRFGSNLIPVPRQSTVAGFSVRDRRSISTTYDLYCSYSAGALRRATHEEMPYQSTSPRGVISRQKMRDFFRSQPHGALPVDPNIDVSLSTDHLLLEQAKRTATAFVDLDEFLKTINLETD